MVTLKEIAAQCGCSVATVSKALNGMPDISPATGERIRAAAAQLGYLPNIAAHTLKTGRSHTIGLLLFLGNTSVWEHGYFSRIASGIQSVTEARGYNLTPVNCNDTSVSYTDICHARGYDGIILMSAGFDNPAMTELVSSDLPLVTIDYTVNHRGAICADNVEGMQLLVEHVHALGHRRIAFIHGEDCAVTRMRLASFYHTCEALGLTVPDAYVLQALYHDLPSTAEATRRLLALPQRPTCILYQDDYAYMGGMRVLKQAGLHIPRDISVTGYDGTELSQLVYPRLTTFRQDSDAIGKTAAQMLLDAIERPRAYLPRHITLPGALLAGESVRDLTAAP